MTVTAGPAEATTVVARAGDDALAVEAAAPVVASMLLHDWREAVRGDEAGELALLAVLAAGEVGTPGTAGGAGVTGIGVVATVATGDTGRGRPSSTADLLDARLAGLASRPAAPPGAGDPLRLAALSGRWPAERERSALEGAGLDGTGPGEALVVLLADVVALARADRTDPALLAGAARRLDLAGLRLGQVVPLEARPGARPVAPAFGAASALIGADSSLSTGPLPTAPAGDGPARGVDETSFARRFLDGQRAVLGFLLRVVPPAPEPASWDAWARGDTRPGHHDRARDRDESPARRWAGRLARATTRRVAGIAIAVAVSAVVALVVAFVPRDLPGRLPANRLAPGQGAVAGVGLSKADGREYVTVRLTGRPRDTEVRLSFAGSPVTVTARQRGSGSQWPAAVSPPGAMSTRDVIVRSRGTSVVAELPGSLHAAGVAAEVAGATAAGAVAGTAAAVPAGPITTAGRAPASGFAPPTARPDPSVNLVDLVLLVGLALAAWRGWRRGLLASLPVLAGFVVTAVAGRALYPLIGPALRGALSSTNRVADAAAVALVTTVVGIALYALSGRATSSVLGRLGDRLPLRSPSQADAALGSAAGTARACLLAASGLVLLADLAGGSRLGGAIVASTLGRGAVSVARSVYGGL